MEKLKTIVKGTILENEPMSKHTTYGIGGPAMAYITPKDRFDLAEILKCCEQFEIPVYFVGSGSNLLVADRGINGIVLSPAKSLKQLEIKGNSVTAESGVMLGRLVKECIKRNFTGLESLIGVPGTLGGAICMNAGSGQLSKMINQICIAGLVQGLSEAMAFGKKANLDMEKVLKVISKGAAQSWQMENRYRTMLDGKFNFGFAVDWMRKDLSICFNESKKNGANLPITKIIDNYYSEVQKNGGNRFDTSSLMTLVDK